MVDTGFLITSRPIGNAEVDIIGAPEAYGDIGPGATIIDDITNTMSEDEMLAIERGAVALFRMRLSYGMDGGGADSYDVTWIMDAASIKDSQFHLVNRTDRWGH